jgi:hypothetical protein
MSTKSVLTGDTVNDLFGPKAPARLDAEKERVRAEKKRARYECLTLLYECYGEIFKKLDQDHAAALQTFEIFAKGIRKANVLPRKPTVKHDRDFDTRLLVARDTAPKGRIKAAVAEAAGAKDQKDAEAAQRRVQRLVAERAAARKRGDEAAQIHFDLLRNGAPRAEIVAAIAKLLGDK